MATQSKTFTPEFIEGFIKNHLYNKLNNITDYENYWKTVELEDMVPYIIIEIPIKRIDNIPVSVFFEIHKDGSLYITVLTSQYYGVKAEYNKIAKYSLKLYHKECDRFRIDYLEENKDEIEEGEEYTYYFDYHEYCRFDVDNLVESNCVFEEVDFEEALNKIINLKWNKNLGFLEYEISDEDIELLGYDINECCVCYEKTQFKCKNGHNTCPDCYIKIKKQQNNNPCVKCPICRVRF
jgi:hypothetical protein